MSKLRQHIIILSNGAFYTGRGFSSEYVDALKFDTRASAKSHGYRLFLDDQAKQIQVIEKYGMEDQVLVVIYGPKATVKSTV